MFNSDDEAIKPMTADSLNEQLAESNDDHDRLMNRIDRARAAMQQQLREQEEAAAQQQQPHREYSGEPYTESPTVMPDFNQDARDIINARIEALRAAKNEQC